MPFVLVLQLSCGWVGRQSGAQRHPGGDDASVTGREPSDAALDVGLDAAIALVDAEADAHASQPEAALDAAMEAASLDCPGAAADGGLADSCLLLRYDFSGDGTMVKDLVSGQDGIVQGGAALDGSGALSLDGVDDFVSMPSRLVSKLSSVTVMSWLTWDRATGGGCTWERVCAFGSSDAGPGNAGFVRSSLSLTLSTCPELYLAGLLEVDGPVIVGDMPAAAGRLIQVALVIDAVRGEMRVYQDGALAGTGAIAHSLREVEDTDDWIGRSNWIQDSFLQAHVDEFRIYGRALTDSAVMEAYLSGPDRP